MAILVLEDDDEDDDDLLLAPLEFTVTDCPDNCDGATDEPLAFAAEATEDAAPSVPQPLSPAIDDALSRLCDRKRKSDEREATKNKSQRVAVVPSSPPSSSPPQSRLHK